MHLRLLLAALLVAAVGAARALPAAEPWIGSPHLELLSDAGEEKAREAARRPLHQGCVRKALVRPRHHARAEAWVLIDSV